MVFHLLVPHLWPPPDADDAGGDVSLPGLETLLGKGTVADTESGDAEGWLCRKFGLQRRGDWPVAPLGLLADGGNPGTDFWLRADPVFLRADARELVLAGTPARISREEADALTAALSRHFEPDGLAFRAPGADRWYLRPSAPPAIETRTPGEAAGRHVDAYLPSGADALRWHTWLNEIQMLLHAHPVNEARENRGELPVNSVWIWGGGVLPANAVSPFARVCSDEPTAAGLALTAKAEQRALPGTAEEWLSENPRDGQLAVLDQLREPAYRGDGTAWREAAESLDEAWFAPLAAALREKRMARLEIHAPGLPRGRRAVVEAADFWKFWRRARRLGEI